MIRVSIRFPIIMECDNPQYSILDNKVKSHITQYKQQGFSRLNHQQLTCTHFAMILLQQWHLKPHPVDTGDPGGKNHNLLACWGQKNQTWWLLENCTLNKKLTVWNNVAGSSLVISALHRKSWKRVDSAEFVPLNHQYLFMVSLQKFVKHVNM